LREPKVEEKGPDNCPDPMIVRRRLRHY
jgi:hypothetical protein